MIRAVIFDLDGTLIDSAPDIHAAANQVLEGEGLPHISFDQARSFVGRGARVFVERMEHAVTGGNEPARTAHLHAQFLYFYERAHEHTRIYPHVPEMLAELRGNGLALGLCTNKPLRPTQAALAYLGWKDMFDVVIGGDSLDVAKPDPAPLLAVVTGLGLTLPEIIYIGDSETDAETAERAGSRFGLYTKGYRKTPAEQMFHHFRFDDYRQMAGQMFQPG
ncbi:phosphoglycolate phosphatase [Roseinatronobacter alkalisoli]|uniref:phosphoglycolate phosphatase n=1 Tax=Roseinatronobacter alkalisoli TaxID=3028235 RepID=A0ABT5TBK2_9RHOB|nr:phosphoglycolate phosphatase [Roseinatronobacter sp. HJB301]MDD7972509.1 phosphoglycolate phosphatase [Roseinatronobacter sp. HJB301]